jgi:hypothetical protein
MVTTVNAVNVERRTKQGKDIEQASEIVRVHSSNRSIEIEVSH